MSSINSNAELKSQIDGTITNTDPTLKIEATKKLRFHTYKNLFLLCVAFLLQFTAFRAINNLQSSLNTEANVGVNSLSIIYGFLIFSSIFLPHPLMALLGLKWTIVICQIPYVSKFNLLNSNVFFFSYLLYVAANYYPKAYLMYPGNKLFFSFQ
jgi:hypothetical protein